MKIPIKQGGSDSGHWLWFLQRITGIGVLVIIIIHWVLQHFISSPVGIGFPMTDYAIVVARLSQPGWRVLYSIFLIVALFHGFHGLWMIGRDYLHAKWSQVGLATILISVSLTLAVWGLIILFSPYKII
jgi:succinate dehydrogenase hydrophobic anchor subunit